MRNLNKILTLIVIFLLFAIGYLCMKYFFIPKAYFSFEDTTTDAVVGEDNKWMSTKSYESIVEELNELNKIRSLVIPDELPDTQPISLQLAKDYVNESLVAREPLGDTVAAVVLELPDLLRRLAQHYPGTQHRVSDLINSELVVYLAKYPVGHPKEGLSTVIVQGLRNTGTQERVTPLYNFGDLCPRDCPDNYILD